MPDASPSPSRASSSRRASSRGLEEPAVPGRPPRRARDDEEIRLVSGQAEIPCGIDELLREGDACIDVAIAHGPVLTEELAEEKATRGSADGVKRLDCGWASGRGGPSRGNERKCEHKHTERWDSDLFHHVESLPRW